MSATLCQQCQSIPFHDLPPFPDGSYDRTLSGYEDFHTFLHYDRNDEIPNPFGFQHHTNLESLRRASASGCELCRQIETHADGVLADIATKNARYAQFPEVKFGAHDPSFNLWITKRPDGEEGFWVSTKSASAPDRLLFPISTFGFCSEDDDPLSSVFPGRPVNGPPDNKVLDRVVRWVETCNSHKSCTANDKSLPTRVIDVGSPDTETMIKLVEVEEGTKDRYIALSYCWGTVFNRFTTSRSSLIARKSGINLSDLPRTFQDAVAMTRRLGVRYLWIDSLCICQDDDKEWERESARMAAVYSNAYLTIACTGKSDSTGGLFFNRPPRRYLRIPFRSADIDGHVQIFPLQKAKEIIKDYRIRMKSEPLAERAWAFQERVLARRVLHFASDQICLECLEGTVYEDGLRLPERYYSIYNLKQSTEVTNAKEDMGVVYRRGHDITDPLLGEWNSMLWEYGSRKLTFPSDKLPALAGVAKVYSELLNDEYVAGLWRKSMLKGLFWQSLRCTAIDVYRGPSWSWVSVDGTPAMGYNEKHRDLAAILDYHVEIDGDNPFGRVKNGWIKIEAPLVPVFLSEKKGPTGHMCVSTQRGADGEETAQYCDFDTIDRNYSVSAEMVQQMKLFTLVLAVTVEEPENEAVQDSKVKYYKSLIVTPADEVEAETTSLGPMKRVGWMSQVAEFFRPDELNASRATVTLI